MGAAEEYFYHVPQLSKDVVSFPFHYAVNLLRRIEKTTSTTDLQFGVGEVSTGHAQCLIHLAEETVAQSFLMENDTHRSPETVCGAAASVFPVEQQIQLRGR